MTKDLTKEECEVEIIRLTDLVHLKELRKRVERLRKEVDE